MKKLHFSLFALLIMLSCAKENTIDPIPEQSAYENGSATTRGEKRNVCHNGMIINVSINAIPAHLAHGDAVDMDEDGFFEGDNPCSATDCDDSDAGVNPDAPEIPCNEIDDDCNSATPDSSEEICDNNIDDDCDGYVDENDSDCTPPCDYKKLPVLVDPNGISGDADDYTIYVLTVDLPFGSNQFIPWSLTSTVTGATDVWDGLLNTNVIVADQNPGTNYAAGLCASLPECDWYLPSKGELDAIYQQLGPGGNNNFANGWYLSSTEVSSTHIWAQSFANGAPLQAPKGGDFPGRCRCVTR